MLQLYMLQCFNYKFKYKYNNNTTNMNTDNLGGESFGRMSKG